MAKSREHFALDWIKGELLETLNTARQGLEAFAEALDSGAVGDGGVVPGDDRGLRQCSNGLHQIHGTLVMLELEGVTLLADHLEQVTERLREGRVADVAGACQSLMQGILELPGHIDELQSGAPDSTAPMLPLINDLRTHLGEPALEAVGGIAPLHGVAGPASLRRFEAIDGVDKTRKIRAVYQQMLLSLLKGGDVGRAAETLRKVAQGMERVCGGTPFQGLWQAFAEFVESLIETAGGAGKPLDSDAVKLLRRIDSEIREIAQKGIEALERPVPVALVHQLVDAASTRGRAGERLDALREAAARGPQADSLVLSGRQALASAAMALREEVGTIKDRLDLFSRSERRDPRDLGDLLAPLKQVASTLSLLGFESSKSIVLDQVDALSMLAETGQIEDGAIFNVAGALMQVDENLASLTQSGRGEVEQITSDAQRAVAEQTRTGLDDVKNAIVDYVSSQWDVRHLQDVPAALEAMTGALRMIPLNTVADLVGRCEHYVRQELMAGHVPTWAELDQLADALSGIDYYLERLAGERPVAADDVLELVERSLDALGAGSAPESTAAALVPEPPAMPEVTREEAERSLVDAEPAPETAEAQAPEPMFGAAVDVDVTRIGDVAEAEEPALTLETEADFDLASSLFDSIPGQTDTAVPEIATTEPGQITPEPEFSTTAAEASSAEPAIAATLKDDFGSDDEIVEIFVEEVGEVLDAIAEQLATWQADLSAEDPQTEIRRAFHTLKGSGRMVGANVLGEMAWSVENMLNRLLDGTVQPTAEFAAVVDDAQRLVPALRDAFEARRSPDMSGVARVMEQADVLASGGTLAEAGEPASLLPGAEPETVATGSTVPGVEPATGGTEQGDDDRLLFLDEARMHVASLRAAARDGEFDLGEEPLRALHTLSGSASMAGVPAIGELVAPAYELAQALRQPEGDTLLTGERAEFFDQVGQALMAMLAAVAAGSEPEDQFQLIAEADRLLMAAEARPPAAELLGMPALATLLQAPDFLEAWREGAMDMAFADTLGTALAEVAAAAGSAGHSAVARLAGSLQRAYQRFEFEALEDGAWQTFADAHERLLAQIDAIAAQQQAEPVDAVCRRLDALQPAPATDQDDLSTDELAVEAGADSPVEPTAGVDVDGSDAALASDDLIELPGLDELVELEAQPEPDEAVAAQDVAPLSTNAGPAPGHAATPAPRVPGVVLPDEVDEDIIAVFFEEADELLEALDHGINGWSADTANRVHLENLLRALHTLKGGARLSGLSDLGDQAHEFESFLIEFQESGGTADAALFTALHERHDAIAAQLAGIRQAVSGAASPPPESVAEAEPAAAAPPAVSRLPAPEPAGRAEPARPPVAARAVPAEAEPVAEAGSSKAAARETAAQEMVRVGAGLLEALVNLAGESSIIRARVEQGMSDFTGALDEMETTIERLREQLRRLEIETEAQVLFRHERLDVPSYDEFDPLEMDRYSQLQQLSRALSESASDMLDLKDTLLFKAREAETLLLQQARVNTELQEGLMRSRMVPFSRLLPRLRRTVRQVAKELDKTVELHAFNIEGELDRSLLERMVPPLEHMLRNAVDHGIEPAEQRRAHGKADAGRIDLRLSREGGDVVIEISDDGAGIDVDRVRAKAVERGLMAADANLRDDEISQFVLAPGFTTARSVTQISGRGVGMDVVHSEVKQLGGSISINSQPGRGTRFVVRVPFTVSVNRALMVSIGDDLYAIPLNTIEGIVLLNPQQLERLYAPDGNTFEYAGVPYRVQYLGNFLGREFHPQPMQGSVPVVLVRSGEHAVAVHVDGVQGSREIVVKSLGPQFAGVGGISGATILGDGSVVVILDLLALIRAQAGEGLTVGKRSLTGAARTRCVMVVDDSVTVRKVTSRLLERQGMDVLVAKDGVEAVSMLQERRPDVMLLDIEMPRMDGFEVLRQVRHDERLRDLPIVMISSRTGAKHQDRAAELGVNRFLGKPFQESELLGTIDELVR
jgi:chemosensory pili system protein ChpA (sensor histidine kinase/response regulator)